MYRRLVLLCALAAVSCNPSGDDELSLPAIFFDATVADTGASDLDAANNTPDEKRVVIDLSGYLPEPGANPRASVRQLESDDAPFSGSVIMGRTGDWILENERIRVLIEGDKRAMSPCPWGGTPIDAAYLEGGTDEDILGEVCLLLNGALTFKPDRFEIVADGSDGGAAVLAADGRLVINDFLNLPAMVDDVLPGFGDRIVFDVNEIFPVVVTTYYILSPDATDVRMLTAMRNDTDEQIDTVALFLVASGGDGYYFNPLSSTKGFGSAASSVGLALDEMPFIAFNGESAGYAFAAPPVPSLDGGLLPLSGSYLIISGVVAALVGETGAQLAQLLTGTKEGIRNNPDLVHILPNGGVAVIESQLFVGDGAVSTVVDAVYESRAVQTGALRGVVTDDAGEPIAGARVSAILNELRTMNQAIADDAGRFEMRVPVGDYDVIARRGAWSPDGQTPAAVAANGIVDVEVRVKRPGVLKVDVTAPDDGCAAAPAIHPVPSRLTILCPISGDCNKPTANEQDISFHGLPSDFYNVFYGGASGQHEIELPPGTYRVSVSRGMEWTAWPADGPMEITIATGETVELDAEIARVIDTAGAYSGDFHIHSISSPDSTVEHHDRVLNFAAEGVDVMVSTDHDYISDYGPVISELGLDPWIQGVVGDEVTTADLGHFNAFPLVRDPAHGRGGAIDWGNGEDFTLTPETLYAAIDEHPGEQVIQMNHAGGLGFIKLAKADPLRGITYASREKHRLPAQEGAGKIPEDTGFWSDGFTAMELMNGNSRGRWYRLARWWMQMTGRGFTPTGTGVTDTHKLYADLGGVPRTYVFGNNDVSCGDRRFGELNDYDAFLGSFVTNVNRGAAVGTNGPFMQVTADSGTQSAAPGETLATNGESFVARVKIQAAPWVVVDEIDVYLNPPLADVATAPGQPIDDPIPATMTVPVTWDPAVHEVEVRTGTQSHSRWEQTIDIPLDSAEDAFLVIVAKGSTSMSPVALTGPFAFANPVFIDADGNGYDNPPYADEAATLPAAQERWTPPAVPSAPITPAELFETVRKLDCQNPAHLH